MSAEKLLLSFKLFAALILSFVISTGAICMYKGRDALGEQVAWAQKNCAWHPGTWIFLWCGWDADKFETQMRENLEREDSFFEETESPYATHDWEKIEPIDLSPYYYNPPPQEE